MTNKREWMAPVTAKLPRSEIDLLEMLALAEGVARSALIRRLLAGALRQRLAELATEATTT